MQVKLLFWLKAFNFDSMLLKMVIGMKGFEFLGFYPILPSVRPRIWSFWSRIWSKVAQLVNASRNWVASGRGRAHGLRGRAVGHFSLFMSFLMACPIPTIPIAVVLDMMKNKTNKSWKYLESREGYFGHLVTIFVINFVGYKEGKLVEGGSAGVASDPKASTS